MCSAEFSLLLKENVCLFHYIYFLQLMNQSLLLSDSCYAIPNVNVRGHLCKTNIQPQAAMRAAGTVQPVFFAENLLREVSSYLKMPALQVITVLLKLTCIAAVL
jgi:CO/xanthine dehydrogenase Mo-binding subunit